MKLINQLLATLLGVGALALSIFAFQNISIMSDKNEGVFSRLAVVSQKVSELPFMSWTQNFTNDHAQVMLVVLIFIIVATAIHVSVLHLFGLLDEPTEEKDNQNPSDSVETQDGISTTTPNTPT